MNAIVDFLVEHHIPFRTLFVILLTAIAIYLYLKNRKIAKKYRVSSGSNADASATVYNKTTRSSMETLKEAGVISIVGIGLILILYVNGVNVTAGLAGLGIAGTIFGLAMQDYLKDTIMGIRIVEERFFEVGEVVRLNGITGVVVGFSLRCTKIENLEDHSMYSICNGQITSIERLSHLMDILIPFPYEVTHAVAKKAVTRICSRVWMLEGIENCYYKGVYEFSASSVDYKLRCFSKPERHPDLRLEVQGIVREVFNEMKIEIPFTQMDVHMKQ